MEVQGRPTPIRYYQEESLETKILCDACTAQYVIYGVFAFCPNCGSHNSLQMLLKNLEVVGKQVTLGETLEGDLGAQLIADGLENAVSAFDGFGREVCRVTAERSSSPAKAENQSFQNLAGVRQRLMELFSFDLASAVQADQWEFAVRCFQKRHLLAHKMGVVDEAYLKATNDQSAVVGGSSRKSWNLKVAASSPRLV